MKRNVDVSSLLALCVCCVCAVLASGTGCSIYSQETNPDPPPWWVGEPVRVTDWDLPPNPARGTLERGNAEGKHVCDGYERYHHYEHSVTSGTQLHVVGISKPSTLDSGNRGHVDVHVSRSGKSVLVLSSYDAAVWNVTSSPGVTVERVILNGYHAQKATVPEGTEVEIHSYDQTSAYLGEFGYAWPSYRANALVNAAEDVTGLLLTSFRGCSDAEMFDIGDHGPLRPPHPVSESTEPGILAGCEHLVEESNYCLSIESGNIYMLGLDSGEVCYGQARYLGPIGEASLGWVGDYLYTCRRDRGLARISLLDSSVDIAPLSCEVVTSHKGGLLALISDIDRWYLAHYRNFAAAVTNEPERVFAIEPFASRIATNGEQVYFSPHNTSLVATALLQDDSTFTSIPLEGYDNPVQGLEVTDDGQLLVGSPDWNGGLHIFDAETGAFKRRLESQHGVVKVSGLECVSGTR